MEVLALFTEGWGSRALPAFRLLRHHDAQYRHLVLLRGIPAVLGLLSCQRGAIAGTGTAGGLSPA